MKEKKIILLGHLGHGRTALASMNNESIDLIISEPEDYGFEINDVRYVPKEQYRPSNRWIAALTKIYFDGRFSNVANGAIIKEFKLIQDKKSNLSKSNRDEVEREFKKRFKLKADENHKKT